MPRCGNENRKGCGREILWGYLPGGRKVPLELSGLVYKKGPWDPNLRAFAVERVDGHYVDHRVVCPYSSFNTKEKAASKPGGVTYPVAGRDRQVGG